MVNTLEEIKQAGDCRNCAFCKSQRIYTADSWEYAYEVKCKAEDRQISGYADQFDDIPIPLWCPLKLNKPYIPNYEI